MCLLDIFVTHLGELVSCILKMFKLFFTRLYFNLVISKFLGSSIPSHFLMVFSILRIFFFFGFARISFLSSSISWITSLIWVDLIVKGHFSHFQCVSSSLCGRTGPWTPARWGGGRWGWWVCLPCTAHTGMHCRNCPGLWGPHTSHTCNTPADHRSVRAVTSPAGHVFGLQQQPLSHRDRVEDVDVGVEDLLSSLQAPGGSHWHFEGSLLCLVDGPVDGGPARVVHHGRQGEHHLHLSWRLSWARASFSSYLVPIRQNKTKVVCVRTRYNLQNVILRHGELQHI